MKKIIFVRHARAKKDDTIADWDRPLTRKGAESARAIVRDLIGEGLTFDYVATSPVARALSTAMLFSHADCAGNCPLAVISEWSDAMSVECFDQWIGGMAPSVSTLVVVGHLPDILCLVQRFDGLFVDHIPPSGAVVVGIDTENWKSVPESKGTILYMKIPYDAAEFDDHLVKKESEIEERAFQSLMKTADAISGIDKKRFEKHAREYAAELASKSVRGLDVVTIPGGAD
jgi:phosphohistidine phosphatase